MRVEKIEEVIEGIDEQLALLNRMKESSERYFDKATLLDSNEESINDAAEEASMNYSSAYFIDYDATDAALLCVHHISESIEHLERKKRGAVDFLALVLKDNL